MHTRTGLRRAVAAGIVVLAALAAACSSDDGSSHDAMSGDGHMSDTTETSATALPDGVNDADVTFVTGMIPHHQQAVEMADMMLARGADPEIKALAEQIQAAQQPEIDRMRGWLEEWRVGPPSGDMSGGHMGSGMMTDDEMAEMGSASGADMDRMFLEMMIRHHEGAIEMARDELADGVSVDARALAQAILDGQQAEITRMRQLGSA